MDILYQLDATPAVDQAEVAAPDIILAFGESYDIRAWPDTLTLYDVESPTLISGDDLGFGPGGTVTSTATLSLLMDNDGAPIDAGISGTIPIFTIGTITRWTLTARAGEVASAVIDVKSCARTAYPGGLVSICGGALPTLVAGDHAENASLPTWTATVHETDVLQIVVTSVSGATQLTLGLEIVI